MNYTVQRRNEQMKSNDRFWKVIIAFLFVLTTLMLLLMSTAMASNGEYYGTKLSISATDYEKGQPLQLTIEWSASYASGSPEQDSGLAIYFSGMKAVEMLNDDGADGSSIWMRPRYSMSYDNSFHGSCTVSIPEKYLEPGTLVIKASVNQTTGTGTVEIPEFDQEAAPEIISDYTEVLLGENAKMHWEGNTQQISEWFMVGRNPDRSWSQDLSWHDKTDTEIHFSRNYSTFPSASDGTQVEYSYYFRYKSSETGSWSAYSEPVNVTLTRKGELESPVLEIPAAISRGSEGCLAVVKNPVEGVNYALIGYGEGRGTLEKINEHTWQLIPYCAGDFHFMLTASAPGYESVNSSADLTIENDADHVLPAPNVTIVDNTAGKDVTFRIEAQDMSEIYVTGSGLNTLRQPLSSGDLLQTSFFGYGTFSVSFYARTAESAWSEQRTITLEILDPTKLPTPQVTVLTDEDGMIFPEQDVLFEIAHVPGAASYRIESQTTIYSYPYTYSTDFFNLQVEATGEDLLVKIPGDKVHYSVSNSNRYTISVTAVPESGSELQESLTRRVEFLVSPPQEEKVIIDLTLGEATEGKTDINNYQYFKYTPEEDGLYSLKSTGVLVNWVHTGDVYDENWEEITCRKDFWQGKMEITAALKKNRTYYYKLRRDHVKDGVSTFTGCFPVTLTKVDCPVISLEQVMYNTGTDDYAAFAMFCPQETGYYTFSLKSNFDKQMEIYDAEMNYIAASGTCAGSVTAWVDCEMTENRTYYFALIGRGQQQLLSKYKGADTLPETLSVDIQWDGIPECGNSLTLQAMAGGGEGNYKYNIFVSVNVRDEDIVHAYNYWCYDRSGTENNEWILPLYMPGKYIINVSAIDERWKKGESQIQVDVTGENLLQQKVENLAARFKSEYTTEYERALAVHDWLIDHAEYDYSYLWHGAAGVLLEGKGVCQSFTEAFTLLIKEMGMEAYSVSGNAYGTMPHSWNEVRIDGEWYDVDVTWDECGVSDIDQSGHWYRQPTHMYCFLNGSLFDGDHVKNAGVSYPACTSLKSNYYVRSGFARENWISMFSDEINNYLDSWELNFEINADFILPLENGIEISGPQWALVEYILNNEVWEHKNIQYNLQVSRQNGILSIQAEPVIHQEKVFILPEALESIESEAFTGLKPGTVIRIPASVSFIAPDAFDRDVIVLCDEGSTADEICRNYGLKVITR